ncbi:MAG TPA: serine/threonine-protein kinase [Streptosporangiaceae bacterium]|nr:serine/threonine-protein kinase [Streptosporangiaceae bacterium]
MTSTDADLTDAREGIADYRFIRVLGAGNHGVFYLAHRPQRLPVSAEFVAVKVLSGTSSRDTFRRAIRELAAFAAVSSPYLVTLYDAGQQGNDLYYSMEYFAQGSLADQAEPVQRHTALTAVSQAARATHALHEGGIAHNDIKPGNILLHDGGGRLSDLGLSQQLTPGLTVTGLGSTASVEYLDPALVRGEAPSRASDVFALGATLHWALTGKGLYGVLPSDSTLLAMRRVLSRPAAISANLEPGAREVIASAISADRAMRPATALELAERIDALAP